MVQVALERPAVGHLLAAGDAGLSYPGKYEAGTIRLTPSIRIYYAAVKGAALYGLGSQA